MNVARSHAAWLGLSLTLVCACASAHTALTVVAAENFYGDVARQLGAADTKIIDVLSKPDADPHLYEASPSIARAVSTADLVIYNGLNYDPWMTTLLAMTQGPSGRRVIVAAALVPSHSTTANPHLWYDPVTMPLVAKAVSREMRALDPTDASGYARRLEHFLAAMREVDARIAALRTRYAGQPIAATEPICEYLIAALGLELHDRRFQLATMNNTEPSARDTAEFEDELRHARVRALIYNRQASNSAVERLIHIARESNVPVVAVTETQPAGVSYQQWILNELDALDRALSRAVP
jgi:zinc/manganese transport system substrate-binding protein